MGVFTFFKLYKWYKIAQSITSIQFIATQPHLAKNASKKQGCHSFNALKIEEIWGRIANIFEEICQNLAQNLRIKEISHMYVLVNLTFTDAMSSNITVHSKRNTMLTVGEKWNFYVKLCNLSYTILIIWTHIICKWTNTLSH